MSAVDAWARMPRANSLTGWRWWAAFYVFGYHMLVFAPLPARVSAVLHYGYLGVTFFFVLSGFVLTWSLSQTIAKRTFYWRRFARIYPSHLVALLLAIPVFYSFSPAAEDWWVKPVNIGVLALSFVLLQGWSKDPTILFSGNPAAWTLTCEAFFYALHPYISKILTPLRVRGALVFAGVVVAILFGYRIFATLSPGSGLAELPWPVVRLTEFALGMALAWAFRRGWRPRLPLVPAMIFSALLLLAIIVLPRQLPENPLVAWIGPFSNELATVLCAVIIVAAAARDLAGKRSMFASRIQVWLGEMSYTFYLVHATFIYIALSILGPRPEGWFNLVWFAALFVVALAGAAALHYLVERPAEKRLRAWEIKRREASAARELR